MSAHAPVHPVISSERRSTLSRRIRLLVVFTISYNVVEGVVALVAGAAASSSALIGFGLDSVIEVSSAAAVAWQFAGPEPKEREKAALRVIALSFLGLAAFVAYDASSGLLTGHEAQHSTVGIALAAASLLVMPSVSLLQRRTGHELGSHSAVADSKQTLLCTYMSGVLLVGLVLNATLGWWWADPLSALVIAGLAVREGIAAWNGDACCSAEAMFEHHDHDHDDGGPGPGQQAACADGCRDPSSGAASS